MHESGGSGINVHHRFARERERGTQMASKKSSTKRTVVSFKDVQIAYLLDGIHGVEKLVAGRKSAGTVIRRALRELKQQGRSVDALESYVGERYGSGGRG